MTSYSLKELIDSMLTELSGISRASDNTIEAYQRDLSHFSKFCEEKEINSVYLITEKVIRLYMIRLNEAGLDKSSVSRKLSAMRRMFNFALRNDIIEFNPIAKISNPKLTRKLPETISLDSFLKIFTLLEEEKNISEIKRNKAIFELLYGCALRVSELCGLNFGDIDLFKMNVRVLGKGAKVRIVPLGHKSASVLKNYLSDFKDVKINNPLFIDKNGQRINRDQVYKIVHKYINKVSDVKKKSPHVLRHSAATHMLDNEADIMAVKEILGHENLSTTQIYTHVSIERLKKSYKKAHPKS